MRFSIASAWACVSLPALTSAARRSFATSFDADRTSSPLLPSSAPSASVSLVHVASICARVGGWVLLRDGGLTSLRTASSALRSLVAETPSFPASADRSSPRPGPRCSKRSRVPEPELEPEELDFDDELLGAATAIDAPATTPTAISSASIFHGPFISNLLCSLVRPLDDRPQEEHRLRHCEAS